MALYSLAAYARRPWPALALLAGLAGSLLTTGRLWLAGDWAAGTGWGGGPPGARSVGWGLFLLAALVAVVVAPWGLGRFRRVRAAYVGALEEQARRAEQDRAQRAAAAVAGERARIAREMHDVVAHALAVIVRQAEGGRYAAARDPASAVQVLSTVADTGREALADMRGVLGALRADEPATAAPQPAVEDLAALVERVRATGLTVHVTTSGHPVALERSASLAAYRVVQEALTNVVKHAGPRASATVVQDWHDGGLELEVRDDGCAAPGPSRDVDGAGEGADDGAGEGGHGLLGMRERVGLAGGRLSTGARTDGRQGFAVHAHLPARGSPA